MNTQKRDNPMTLKNAFDSFILDQRLRGNTEKTIRGYQGFLTRFIDWQAANGVIDLAELSLQNIQQYQLYINTKPAERNGGEKLTKRSVQTYMRHIKVFLTFCFEEGFHLEPLHQKIKLPKAERPVIEILTDEEIAAILKTFGGTENEKRNRALILILLDCGLRLSEVVGIKICDINFSRGYIMVNGKGRKGRIVPIGERVTHDMKEYQQLRNRAEHEKFFLTKNFAPMTSGCIHSLMRRLKKRTGIKRIHAHLFRHTFATNFLVHGLGDVYELSRLLGHSEIKVTEKYLQLASYYTIMQNRKKLSYLDYRENSQKNQQE
jgi:integrase/recombinase XerC/integrase/recombinase XerD